MNVIDLKNLCLAEDWDGIEGGRDYVVSGHLPELIDFYWELKTWPAELGVVQLIQDQISDGLRPVMLDVLRAPDVDTWFQDLVELSKAVALGFVDERYDTFMEFYNNRGHLRSTVLQVLAENKMVQEVVQSNPVDVSAKTKALVATGLLAAVRQGDLEEIRRCLSAGESPNQYVDDEMTKGCTYLMEAIASDQFDAAWLLLEFGADLNIRTHAGVTPLMLAAGKGNSSVIKHLLQAGADPTLVDRSGALAVDLATGRRAAAVHKVFEDFSKP